jgi:hypothetical protein
MADDQRIRPTVQGRARLLRDVAAVPQTHAVDAGTLGEYAQLLAEQGQRVADGQLQEVARHLATGCPACAEDLDEFVRLLSEDADPQPSEQHPAAPVADDAREPIGASRALRGNDPADLGMLTADDSGIHVRDLPDPRQAEAQAAAARRQQLRRLRERLLIAAAVAVLLMGLSLIGLAYLARAPRETPRLDLAPVGTPAGPGQQPAAPPAQSAPAGISAPSGMDCPASHPVKGNRDSMIYHVPGGSFYGATRPEQCFAQPVDAEAAGYRRSQR